MPQRRDVRAGPFPAEPFVSSRPERRTQAERSAYTRSVLLDAAIKTLFERGYASTTTTLVATEAGISRGAMLHQFSTKSDLMIFVVEEVFRREVAQYAELLRGIDGPRDRGLAYTEAVWSVLSQPSGVAVLEILQGSRSDPELGGRLRVTQARIEEEALAVLKNYFEGGVSLAMMRLVVWAARGLSIAKMLAPDPDSIDDAMQTLNTLISNSFDLARLTASRNDA